MPGVNVKEVFEALPHVNEIWLTDDGKFHLHPHKGGRKVLRNEDEVEEKVETKIEESTGEKIEEKVETKIEESVKSNAKSKK